MEKNIRIQVNDLIKSMTGFGRSEITDNGRKLVVEIKAVNHRYCDMNIKLPKKLGHFETIIRTYLKDYIQRGKVDIYITYEDYTGIGMCVKYNRDIAGEYIGYLRSMAEDFGLEQDIRPSLIGRFPEVFTLEEQDTDEEELKELLLCGVRAAAEQFVSSRVTEGENLRQDLIGKLDLMTGLVTQIEQRSPDIISEYRKRLLDRINELAMNVQVDEQRIAAEVTIFADKVCVDEEIVRLKSHILGMKNVLLAGGEAGRKLDFIAQEMNREANTILSKSGSLDITDIGIELKTDIEKVREQIQNIE